MAEQAIKCAVVIGIKEDGSVFLETHGSEQNLITIDGLLEYGKRYISDEWDGRKNVAPKVEPEVETVEAEIVAPVVEPKPKRKRVKKEDVIDAEN